VCGLAAAAPETSCRKVMQLLAPMHASATTWVVCAPQPCILLACLQISMLRGELEGKARQVQNLQADIKSVQSEAEARLSACEKQVRERLPKARQQRLAACAGTAGSACGCTGWQVLRASALLASCYPTSALALPCMAHAQLCLPCKELGWHHRPC